MSVLVSLLPTAQASLQDWQLGAGADKVTAVQTDDGDTSYDYSDAIQPASVGQRFTGQQLGVEAAIIESVQVRSVTEHTSAGTAGFTHLLQLSGVDGNVGVAGVSGTYQTFRTTHVRPGGGDWTRADVNITQWGMDGNVSSAGQVRVTLITLDVTYTAHVGSLAFLVAGLGPLVAVALREIPALCRAAARLSGSLILPDDYMALWLELRRPRRRYAL